MINFPPLPKGYFYKIVRAPNDYTKDHVHIRKSRPFWFSKFIVAAAIEGSAGSFPTESNTNDAIKVARNWFDTAQNVNNNIYGVHKAQGQEQEKDILDEA